MNYIETFRTLSIKRWTYLNEQQNARKANQFYKKSVLLVKDMLSNQVDLMQLEPLLADENDYVRLESACVLLFVCPEKSEKVLKEIAQYIGLKKGMLAITAETMLYEWYKGNITLESSLRLK